MSTQPLRYAAPIGRILLSLIFLLSAVGKFNDWPGTVKMISDKGLPSADALLSVAVVLEIVGGASVMFGLYARLGAVALLAFMLPVTFIMHNFWTLEGTEQMNHMINFMKNVSITGGVVLVLAFGAGPCSIDSMTAHKHEPHPTAATHEVEPLVNDPYAAQRAQSVVRAAVAVEGGLAVVAVLVGWVVGQPPLQQIAWTWEGALLGVAGAAPMFVALVAVTWWPVGPLAELEDFVRRTLVPAFRSASTPELALICLLAGFGEEMLFRGVAQAWIQEQFGSPWLAIGIASVLFGIAHPITRTYAVVAGLIGVYLGWLLVASGNLLVPAVGDAAYDFAALVFMLRMGTAAQLAETAGVPQGDEWSI